jgi:hypothetical protein
MFLIMQPKSVTFKAVTPNYIYFQLFTFIFLKVLAKPVIIKCCITWNSEKKSENRPGLNTH